MDARFNEVTQALSDYFDGIHEGDLDKLRTVFLPGAHLYSSTEGVVVDKPLAEYLELVGGRASPASLGAKRYDRIVSIDFSGPTTAMVKVELAVAPRFYTDFLTMLKTDGRWRVISKTYEYVTHE